MAQVIARVSPDILLLQGVDYDHRLITLAALRDVIADHGRHYPHIFALRPNTGMPTGIDIDGDGRTGGARDRQSFGQYSGQDGMALLSRHPVRESAVEDFSSLLWKDVPGSLALAAGEPEALSASALNVQRLSSTGHWVIPIQIGDDVLKLLTFHATPPVFDGPEDRNGRRNHDEIRFWQHYLDGAFGPATKDPFILIGNANLDPYRSEGRKTAILSLLSDPRLQDPRPARTDEPTALDTVDWPPPGPGKMRVSYILPSAGLIVSAAGVYWPEIGTAEAAIVEAASRHRVVWIDLELE